MTNDVPGDDSITTAKTEQAENQESENTAAALDAKTDEEPLSELERAQRGAVENQENYLRIAAELQNLRTLRRSPTASRRRSSSWRVRRT